MTTSVFRLNVEIICIIDSFVIMVTEQSLFGRDVRYRYELL